MKTENQEGTATNGMAVQPPAETKTEIIKPIDKVTPSERFVNSVLSNFASNNGKIQLTSFQEKLIQNYFIKLDSTLKDLEAKNSKKTPQYKEPLAYNWNNVNMTKLSTDVVAWSSIGLDPTQPNHVSLIPYKNKETNRWDIGFLPGYNGLEIKSKKYGLDVPDFFISELKYTTDIFKSIKKDMNNRVEGYVFEITNEFNRGTVEGGFYYHGYIDNPEKNKLKTFSLSDIEKRKPTYASVEFWGGEKDKWETDPNTNKSVKVGKVKIDGWFDEMALKTIKRACYNAITIDASKIDEHYLKTIQGEKEMNSVKIENEILENANKESLDFDDAVMVDNESKQVEGSNAEISQPDPVQETSNDPGF
ncbi:recombinational DNA repair protein (RecE pathway) [Flavobacterium sp. ZT3R17]|uniref:recombinational DNA repair protein (RecE pathway) n=1 Tax=Flavobacterium cryoconiti TaxID=3398736 RepID=UPI003A8B75E8